MDSVHDGRKQAILTPRLNAVIFEVAPAGPDALILDVFKGASEHDGNGGCSVGDGDGDGGGGQCVLVMSV